MPAEVRVMERDDIEVVADMWREYVDRSILALDYSRRITENNLARIISDRRTLSAVAEYDDRIVGFLHGRVDYWVMNDQPFINEVALYVREGETGAAGLQLLRWMHKQMEERKISQSMVAFYGGVEEEKIRALLGGMGYTGLGGVMHRGVSTWPGAVAQQ